MFEKWVAIPQKQDILKSRKIMEKEEINFIAVSVILIYACKRLL